MKPAPSRPFAWRLAAVVSRLLDSPDGTVALGDLQELGVSGPRALREVLGLVVRRQLSAWRDCMPWLALVSVVLPIGVLLSHVSRWWSDTSALYFVWYVKGWTTAFLASPGARRDLVELATSALLSGAALIAWSWTSGYALALLARRTTWIVGALFCLVVVFGAAGTTTVARVHNPPLALTYYAVVWPRLLQATLVLLPAVVGIRHAVRRRPARVRLLVTALVSVLMTVWASGSLETAMVHGRNRANAPGPNRVFGTSDDVRASL